jgi:hypothetical protein
MQRILAVEQATVEEATLTANEGWKQCEVSARGGHGSGAMFRAAHPLSP